MELADLTAEKQVEVVDGVHLAQLAVGEQMSLNYFEVAPGAETPKHSHEHEQLGFVYQGEFSFSVGGETYVASPGSAYYIPSNEPHAAANFGETPVKGIDIFSPPRVDPAWKD